MSTSIINNISAAIKRCCGGCHCRSGWHAYRLGCSDWRRRALLFTPTYRAAQSPAAAASLHDCQLMPSASHRDIRHSSPRSPRYNYAVTPCECTGVGIKTKRRDKPRRQRKAAGEGYNVERVYLCVDNSKSRRRVWMNIFFCKPIYFGPT